MKWSYKTIGIFIISVAKQLFVSLDSIYITNDSLEMVISFKKHKHDIHLKNNISVWFLVENFSFWHQMDLTGNTTKEEMKKRTKRVCLNMYHENSSVQFMTCILHLPKTIAWLQSVSLWIKFMPLTIKIFTLAQAKAKLINLIAIKLKTHFEHNSLTNSTVYNSVLYIQSI